MCGYKNITVDAYKKNQNKNNGNMTDIVYALLKFRTRKNLKILAQQYNNITMFRWKQ